MRRRAFEDDSLELLLDTICNVFGGIIFIAILVALLTSDEIEQVASDTKDRLQNTRAVSSYRKLEARAASLQIGIRELMAMKSSFEDPNSDKALAILERIKEEQQKASGRLVTVRNWIHDYDELVTDKELKVQQLHHKLESNLKESRDALAKLRDAKTIRGRLPVESVTRKEQVIVVLFGNRAFVVPLSSTRTILIANSLDDHVTITGDSNATVVTPVNSSGIPVDRSFQEHPSFKKLIHLFDSDRHFFDLYVAGNSSGAFQRFKTAAVSHGFSYNVTPKTTPGSSFIFYPTNTLRVQ